MSIANFPTQLQAAIQQNFLRREFEDGLSSVLAYRNIAKKIIFPNNIGQTFTDTKTSKLTPNTTPIDPTTNTGLDNGLTANQWSVEQYTMALNLYADTMNLNILTQYVGIAEQFLTNANNLATAAGQVIDRLAGGALRDAYLSGNTYVTATLGSPAATIAVNDVRGFQTVFVNGVLTPISSSHTLTVYVNGTAYQASGYTVDSVNVSTTAIVGGISGTITMTTNVSTTNGTTGNAVVAADAPVIIRPNSRTTTGTLLSTDFLTMNEITNAVTQLKRNAVPKVNGYYNLYIDDIQLNELFQDPVFLQWHRGQIDSTAYQDGLISQILGVRIIPTTEALIQTTGTSVSGGIHRAVLCGADTLYEGDFQGMDTFLKTVGDMEVSLVEKIDNVVFVTRPPLDRLTQQITQSYFWAGGFVAPTDSLSTTAIIPTATSGRYKRAVFIETA